MRSVIGRAGWRPRHRNRCKGFVTCRSRLCLTERTTGIEVTDSEQDLAQREEIPPAMKKRGNGREASRNYHGWKWWGPGLGFTLVMAIETRATTPSVAKPK
jgi:hypothetical protein